MDPPFGFMLDITSLRWTKLAIPVLVNRVYHKALFLDSFVVVFGGAVFIDGKLQSSTNNIVQWNIDNGTTNIVPVDFPLWGFCLLEGLLPNKLVMVGGVTTGDQWSEHLYVYSLENRTLTREISNIVGDVCGAVISRSGTQTAILVIQSGSTKDTTIMEVKGAQSAAVETIEEEVPETESEGESSADESTDAGGSTTDGTTTDDDESSEEDNANSSEQEVETENDPVEFACDPCIVDRARRGLEGRVDFTLIALGEERSVLCGGCGGLFHLVCDGWKTDPYKFKSDVQIVAAQYRCKQRKCRASERWSRTGFKW